MIDEYSPYDLENEYLKLDMVDIAAVLGAVGVGAYVGSKKGRPVVGAAIGGGLSLPIPVLRTIENKRVMTPDEIAADGCVLCLPMNEGAGSTVRDKSGYNNNGTIYGAMWVSGRYGYALNFDGVDDYVEIPHSPSLSVVDELTILVWVKFNELDQRVAMVSKSGVSRNYQFEKVIDNSLQITFQDPDGNWRSRKSILKIEDYNWHMAGVTHNSNSGTTFFLDGQSDFHDNPYKMATNTAPVKIGKGAGLGVEIANGIIDEVLIYNRALTPEEIKAHYLGSRLLKQRSLTVVR
jgi:hypothetical protein